MAESKSQLTLSCKALDESGTFEGVLSTYGNVDSVGDVCERGCFEATIAKRGKSRPMLWQHDMTVPIGSLEILDSESALVIKGRINLDTEKGREAYALLKAGDICGLSIGYLAVDYKYDSEGIRHLTEVDLYEGSVVTFPANESASVTSVKSMEVREDDEMAKITEMKSWRLLDDFQQKCFLEELRSKSKKTEDEEEEAKETEEDESYKSKKSEDEESEKSEASEDEEKSDDPEEDLSEMVKQMRKELDDLIEKMKG